MAGSTDPRTPCIIGVAQQTWHLAGTEAAPEPLRMMEQVVREAAADTDAPAADVLAAVDDLRVVYCMSWPYDDPAQRVAEALGLRDGGRSYSGLSGTIPQQLLTGAATDIVAGDLDVAVVTGAEALDTVRRLKKAGERPAWSFRHPERPPFPLEAPFHPAEMAHNVFQAWLTFAVREVARRARTGAAPDDYSASIGRLMSGLSEVAATNPHAWFPLARTPEELSTPSPSNRLVGYPYTKLEVAIMDVDMAAAVIVASHEAADRLGVPVEQRAYLRGAAYATDAVYVAEHPDLSRSPAMAWAFDRSFRQAGLDGVADWDRIGPVDLYSCFASSIHFACDALGVDPLEPGKPLTVTGGLPYSGGPASNYLGHAISSLVGRLRAEPGSLGLTTGVGMHMTKHSAALYSTEPPPEGWRPLAEQPPEPERLPIVDTYTGEASVAAYTVVHDRDGAAEWGLLVVDVPDGVAYEAGRAYALVHDSDDLARLEAEECVGVAVTLAPGPNDSNVARL